jgi:hypothetical protein
MKMDRDAAPKVPAVGTEDVAVELPA